MTETTPKPISLFKAICMRVLDDWLFIQYPAVFRVYSPIPLAIGTGKELLNQLPNTITKTEFKAAMTWYCGRENYLQAILKGTQRINLQGGDRELGEFKQTTRKSHRILGFKSLLCSHQMILFEPVM